MTIGIILLWMAMQGQTTYTYCCDLDHGEHWSYHLALPSTSAPEHVIKIKTKREEIKERLILRTVGSLHPGVDLSAIPCKSNQFLLLERGQFYCARHRVTR